MKWGLSRRQLLALQWLLLSEPGLTHAGPKTGCGGSESGVQAEGLSTGQQGGLWLCQQERIPELGQGPAGPRRHWPIQCLPGPDYRHSAKSAPGSPQLPFSHLPQPHLYQRSPRLTPGWLSGGCSSSARTTHCNLPDTRELSDIWKLPGNSVKSIALPSPSTGFRSWLCHVLAI